MRALVIDAYDSFVYVIVQYLETLGVETEVRRNDRVDSSVLRSEAPDFIVLGPGPGHPADAGYVDIIRDVSSSIPTFGVCLGHQAIGLAFGAEVQRADHLMHGKTSVIDHDGRGVFGAHATKFHATRYHSLIVEESSVPDVLQVTAKSTDDGYVMGLRHRTSPIESVQFHPESILTENGMALFRNFIDTHVVDEGEPQESSKLNDEEAEVD